MRLPITRNDLRTALPKLARQLADLQGSRLSAAYRDLSWALGYRDLHALQQEAVPDLTPDVLCHVSGRAVNVDGLLPSAVPDTLLYTRMIWNLHRRSERPLSVCEALITRLTLDRLDLQRHTLSAQLKKRHPDRLYVLDESASLWPSDPHRLSARAVGVGAPALRWVVRRDGQVFRWSQLQHWLSLIPAGEDLTDAQLQSVVADAWAPLDRGWEDLEWTNVRVGVLQDQSYQRLGWVLHDKVQSGVFPALYPSEQAARDALLPTLTGDVQPDFSLPIRFRAAPALKAH